MPLYLLDDKLWFPPVSEALDDGLLAIGGDLGVDRLLLAYKSGIFPWYNEDEPPMWWSPDPRFVLLPSELKVSRSMRQVMNSGKFDFRLNTSFYSVIRNCQRVSRPGQDGTWISDEIVRGYSQLFLTGYALCAETWQDEKLVGGLYGIRMGKAFFGESMFSLVSNASKFAFINLVRLLEQEGVRVIDCQVYTEHLERLGARMIPRTEFLDLIHCE